MTTVVPVTVAAKNEERSLPACLAALLASARHAEARLPLRFDVLVVADDCTDGTEAVAARCSGVRCTRSSGGKVEAQRRGVRPGPFQVFCDADVLPAEDTLLALARALLFEPGVFVAFPPKRPLPPRRSSLLARALHLYNLRHGWSSQRTWFNGKCFAIREWTAPSLEDVARRAAALPHDPFLDLRAGLVADDVFLSRHAVLHHGVAALAEVRCGPLEFRAPETLRGMYRYYRRLRRELERIDLLFPETRAVHRQFGARRQDLLHAAPPRERLLHGVFQAALLLCRLAYRGERSCVRNAVWRPGDSWRPIEESKLA